MGTMRAQLKMFPAKDQLAKEQAHKAGKGKSRLVTQRQLSRRQHRKMKIQWSDIAEQRTLWSRRFFVMEGKREL